MPSKNVLILSNDRFLTTAKTSEILADACRRLGVGVMVRNTSEARWLEQWAAHTVEAEAARSAREVVRTTFTALIEAFGIDTVISLDLQWLFQTGLFTETPGIRNIHTLWFDDLRSWSVANDLFNPNHRSWRNEIRHSKVRHHFYGRNQLDEARLLGIDKSGLSYLAAAESYLHCNHPCRIRNRAVFVGNPGLRGPMPESLMRAICSEMELGPLRQLAAQTFAQEPFPKKEEWIRAEPEVKPFLALALELRAESPHRSAAAILKEAGAVYPRAFAYFLEQDKILEAALIVKLVTVCDRPAAVLRLFQKGLLDVFSNRSDWRPFGVEARLDVPIPQLPEVYQRYAVHVNAANALRDATANEKLFEIAACGRVSVNLASPDVAACYGPDEIAMAGSLDELEEKTRQLLNNFARAEAMGRNARNRTAQEHLWEHRLAPLFTDSEKKRTPEIETDCSDPILEMERGILVPEAV